MTQVMTGGVSYLNYDTPSVFAFGESTSLIEGGKGCSANLLDKFKIALAFGSEKTVIP